MKTVFAGRRTVEEGISHMAGIHHSPPATSSQSVIQSKAMCCWGPANKPGNGPACSLTLVPVTDRLVTQNWPIDCRQKASPPSPRQKSPILTLELVWVLMSLNELLFISLMASVL